MMSQPMPCSQGFHRRVGDRGTSLIEMILASLILVFVAIPILSMWEGTTRIFTRGDRASGLHQDLRSSVASMVREIRMTGYDPSVAVPLGGAVYFAGAIGDPLVATPTTVQFIADVDTDGTTDRIQYAYDAPTRTVTRQFWRWNGTDWGAGSGTFVIARNVDSMALAYFDAADALIPTPCCPPAVAPANLGNIRRVTMTLAGSRMVPGHGLEQYAVTSEARPRNLP